VVTLPVAEFAFPGPLRDALVAAILRGEKTSTSSLVAEYEHEGSELPRVGERAVVVDSSGEHVAVIETTEVRVIPVGMVDLDFAREEGEGFTSVAEWRQAHERFWHSREMREALGDETLRVGDETAVVAERFRVVELL
jgi:uncharacterized protein YhfF